MGGFELAVFGEGVEEDGVGVEGVGGGIGASISLSSCEGHFSLYGHYFGNPNGVNVHK